MNIIQAVAVFLLIGFLTYITSIVVPYFRRKPNPPGNSEDFEWHFMVPCRDEEAVIGNTIERLTGTFPGTHIWVIDDDSEDATSSIVQSYAQKDRFVHLVQRRRPEARTGKGDALNTAYHQMLSSLEEGVNPEKLIVCVVDADGELAANALEQAAGPDVFANPKVGAAQTSVWMKNRDDPAPLGPGKPIRNFFGRALLRMQDIEFRTVIVAMQSLREKTASVGLGGNGQFTRLSVLQKIADEAGEPWHGALLEDYELGVHVLLAGYENRHIVESYVAQEALSSGRRLVTQRTRWAQGNIQCIKYLPEIIKSRHFSNASVVESTYYLILPYLQLLGILTWGGMAIFFLISALSGQPVFGGLENIGWVLLMTLLFGIMPFAMWGPIYKIKCEPTASWWRTIGWSIGMWLYVYYTYICLVRAAFRVATGRNGWLKTKRNAEQHLGGPVAKDT
ncbi:cellulose synthase/poly-beta-1,6-N-acetylglucosamine synthase-like glycosyltransferase [Psychromicrobium silvestre]|uniref:Cellulose synthase/poly-beta-1,6-N-acetylglucosamine synthase-like glycosyltransferase n=1 Tax=Psychromicrobium silvestre TaxID=1645614 RepID=A0A7Y9S5V4_9MICC|nr:glycosyltransferase [Psychromicrobium silvestre]NYE94685.1 cellulose synthase/poly-beta-1,6-N-acetylglucosamine synthase-like glycosyltransferase [Psychromicrobium silvestre]